MILDKKTIVFERDEAGKLVPREVELVVDEEDEEQKALKGQTVFITPMLRGEIRKMFAEIEKSKNDIDADLDGELIVRHCVKPSFTAEEVKDLKGHTASALVNTILVNSGLDLGKTRKKAIQDKEDEFGKN